MKRIVLIVIAVVAVANAMAQTPISENDRLATLCRVWGYLKYTHPAVQTGKYDWDKELLTYIPKVKAAKDIEEMSDILIRWIGSLGSSVNATSFDSSLRRIPFNLDNKPLHRKKYTTKALSDTVFFLEKHRWFGPLYYAKEGKNGVTIFDHEKTYPDKKFPDEDYRLLCLFRYWNAVMYFDPNKMLIGNDWQLTLDKLIPLFRNAKDTLSYQLAILSMTAHLDDTHASFSTPLLRRHFGSKWAPIKFEVVDRSAIVTGFYSEALAKKDDIRKNDIITTVGGRDLVTLYLQNAEYLPGSNKTAQFKSGDSIFLNGEEDSVLITYERNGKQGSKYMHRYPFEKFHYNPEDKGPVWKMIDTSIGYIDLAALQPRDTAMIARELKGTRGIVIDARGTPHPGCATLLNNILSPDRAVYLTTMVPAVDFAGTLKPGDTLACGRRNKNAYRGTITIVFDDNTLGYGEEACMALQTIPLVTFVGTASGAADGPLATVPLPGDYKVSFTGVMTCGSDGHPMQRKGVVANVRVKPDLFLKADGHDQEVERAIEFIKTGK